MNRLTKLQDVMNQLIYAANILQEIQGDTVANTRYHLSRTIANLGESIAFIVENGEPQLQNVNSVNLNSDLTPEEQKMVLDRQKINAIKSVRSRLGLGLKEAKDMVDKWESTTEKPWTPPLY